MFCQSEDRREMPGLVLVQIHGLRIVIAEAVSECLRVGCPALLTRHRPTVSLSEHPSRWPTILVPSWSHPGLILAASPDHSQVYRTPFHPLSPTRAAWRMQEVNLRHFVDCDEGIPGFYIEAFCRPPAAKQVRASVDNHVRLIVGQTLLFILPSFWPYSIYPISHSLPNRKMFRKVTVRSIVIHVPCILSAV